MTEKVVKRIFRGGKHRIGGCIYSSDTGGKEYNDKERRIGVMVNFRVSVSEHLSLREEAAKNNITLNGLIRGKVFKR